MANHTTIESSKTPFYQSSSLVQTDQASESTNEVSYAYDSYEVDLPKGLESTEDELGNEIKTAPILAPRSASNPYFNVRVKSITGSNNNYPLNDIQSSERTDDLYAAPNAKNLIDSPRGASIYGIDDFLYVKNYGKLPINRMITLRRFAHPVFDDIFSKTSQSEPDIARLIGYSDQTVNKYSDILSFSCGLKWKPIESASEQARMEGNQNGIGGLIGNVMKFVDPKFGQEALKGANAVNFDPQHDQNRVYGPVDSINSASIRDVGLKFDQKMELTFEYEMRSINGVNQKAAFIDVLSNIIMMCTNDAKFWGGARYWVGPKPSRYMNNLKYMSPDSFEQFITGATSHMQTLFKSISTKSSAKETLKNIANNAMNLALGKLLDTLGRPGIPVMNSLLTGNPIGLWHLTVGNPENPILCAGDLIMDDAQISFGDELGYDDFPTTISVTITMSHPKGKGRAEIESMFNAGKGRTYMKPKDVTNRKTKLALENNKSNARTIVQKKSADGTSNNGTFGDYDTSAIERNAEAVWSFLKNTRSK